ncbi:hypothetical protein LCGC14_0174970 [marine sediment metagenome]|uniref:Uncharacterized protein n=1 Tax=marine sediment metagenome TaxID=412755 RepID=A0A0F9XTL8_9ZZZZ
MKINYFRLSSFFQLIASGLILYYYRFILSDEQRQTIYGDPFLFILFFSLFVILIIINVKLLLESYWNLISLFKKETGNEKKDNQPTKPTIKRKVMHYTPRIGVWLNRFYSSFEHRLHKDYCEWTCFFCSKKLWSLELKTVAKAVISINLGLVIVFVLSLAIGEKNMLDTILLLLIIFATMLPMPILAVFMNNKIRKQKPNGVEIND